MKKDAKALFKVRIEVESVENPVLVPCGDGWHMVVAGPQQASPAQQRAKSADKLGAWAANPRAALLSPKERTLVKQLVARLGQERVRELANDNPKLLLCAEPIVALEKALRWAGVQESDLDSRRIAEWVVEHDDAGTHVIIAMLARQKKPRVRNALYMAVNVKRFRSYIEGNKPPRVGKSERRVRARSAAPLLRMAAR